MQEYTLGRQIAVAARLWRGELDRRLLPHRLSQARYVLLTLLVEADSPLPQNDLAERAGITGPTLVRQLDHLESNDLVERRDAPDDRRVKHVCITKAGHAAHTQADAIAQGLRMELTAGMRPTALTDLHDGLEILLKRLDTVRLPESAK